MLLRTLVVAWATFLLARSWSVAALAFSRCCFTEALIP